VENKKDEGIQSNLSSGGSKARWKKQKAAKDARRGVLRKEKRGFKGTQGGASVWSTKGREKRREPTLGWGRVRDSRGGQSVREWSISIGKRGDGKKPAGPKEREARPGEEQPGLDI